MAKFRLLQAYLRDTGLLHQHNHFRPAAAKFELLALSHCPNYIRDFLGNALDRSALRRLGLPWSEALARRTITAVNGTLLTAHLALKHGVACHLAGGTHHAHYDFGSGFCVFNDLAVTAQALLRQGKAQNVLIFDCDVHQGDGTATLLANQPRAFTCSIHCDKNFPARKATSDLDVEVNKGCGDQEYLDIVETTLTGLLDQLTPNLVLYDAGVDIYKEDPLGLIDISLEGLRQRDALVLESCIRRGIPVATVIGGGYDRDHQALARRHAIVVEEAAKLFR